jgi:DNA modification methylase
MGTPTLQYTGKKTERLNDGWDASNAGREIVVPHHGDTCRHCGAWRGALGLEPTPEAYVAHLVEVFRAVRRVLRADGTCWVNLGDAYASSGVAGQLERPQLHDHAGRGINPKHATAWYGRAPTPAGLKPKDLVGIPWRVAFALQADGWWLRSEIIWAKPNPMPESVTDRPTKAHEQLFLLAKAQRYYFDAEAIRESAEYGRRSNFRGGGAYLNHAAQRDNSVASPESSTTSGSDPESGRQKRSVWTIPSAPFPLAHFATFPSALVEPCVKAGTSERGACPACGAPWRREVDRTAMVIDRSERTHTLGRTRSSGTMREPPTAVTLGWTPGCTCAAGEPVPAVCLDPFGGAGTVALVADRLGRDAILIELKPEYAAMAERRIREEAPLLTAVEVEAPAPPANGNGHAALASEQLALLEP